MRIASINMGTNTLLLLIADIGAGGAIVPVHHEQRFPRLGREIDREGMLLASAFDRAAWIVREFRDLATQFQAETLVACATSAVRDARNQEEFLAYVKKNTGVEVEVLRGEEEAYWSYRGATSAFSGAGADRAVLDIGGGSTELVYPQPGTFNGNTKLNRYSLQLGCVRLTERFLKHQPPRPEELESAARFVIEECAPIHNPGFGRYELIAVAGKATTLACLDAGLSEFDPAVVSGYRLDAERVGYWLHRLQGMGTDEILSLSNAAAGRADILTAGVLVLHTMAAHLGFRGIRVSERGLRYGLIQREWERTKSG
jgi:exopolyphosphatase/guanosine-5'-triphosphate,3'-diphosphate pyrophosphatase